MCFADVAKKFVERSRISVFVSFQMWSDSAESLRVIGCPDSLTKNAPRAVFSESNDAESLKTR